MQMISGVGCSVDLSKVMISFSGTLETGLFGLFSVSV